MRVTERAFDNAEAGYTEQERSGEPLAESDANDELSDADLEEVLGGLERIHFPGEIDLPELDT